MEILIQQEKALHQPEIRQNNNEIERLLSPDFYEVGKSGNSYDYLEILSMMEAEEPCSGYVHSQDYEAIPLETSAVLLLYKSAWIDEHGGASEYTKRSSIWVLNEIGWQMRYHQGTPCEPYELKKQQLSDM